MAPRSVRFGVRSRNLGNVGQSLDGRPKIFYLELLRAAEGIFSAAFAVVSTHQPALGPRSGWDMYQSYRCTSNLNIYEGVGKSITKIENVLSL
jgi:hypothetical protein